jgi:hypothetical protein
LAASFLPVSSQACDLFLIHSIASCSLSKPVTLSISAPHNFPCHNQTDPPPEIAALYKSRWQIELLFRWIKQHLDIRSFLGRNDNAIRLQVLTAMIAYLLLRIAAKINCVKMLPLRLAELVRQFIFTRRSIATITKPPPRQSQNAKASDLPRSVGVLLCLIFPGQPCAFAGTALKMQNGFDQTSSHHALGGYRVHPVT